MTTTNNTFSVKNGLSLANTIILDNNLNLSNLNSLNTSAGNVSGVLNVATEVVTSSLVINSGATITIPLGSVTTAPIHFLLAPGTGIFGYSSATIAFASSSNQVANFSQTAIYLGNTGATIPVNIPGDLTVSGNANSNALSVSNGSLTRPAMSFTSNQGTGLYLSGADTITLTTNGNSAISFSQTSINIANPTLNVATIVATTGMFCAAGANITLPFGSASTVALRFSIATPGTGLFGASGNVIGIASSTNAIAAFSQTNIQLGNVSGSSTMTINAFGTLNVSTINASSNLLIGAANVTVPNSPMINTQTRVLTGLAAFPTTSMAIASNTTLSVDSNLSMTINETGMYAIQGFFSYYPAGANGAGGMKMDLGGGTATVNSIYWTGFGNFANVSGAGPDSSNSAASTSTTLMVMPTLNNSATVTNSDWIKIEGMIRINAAGTIIPRWAQLNSTANATTRAANGSYFILTKIG